MRATLTFHLPDEEYEYAMARDGLQWYSAMHDLWEWMRAKMKYQDRDELTPGVEAAHEKMFEILNERNLEI